MENATAPRKNMPRDFGVRNTSAWVLQPTVKPRNMVAVSMMADWAVLARRFTTPHSFKKFPKNSIPGGLNQTRCLMICNNAYASKASNTLQPTARQMAITRQKIESPCELLLALGWHALVPRRWAAGFTGLVTLLLLALNIYALGWLIYPAFRPAQASAACERLVLAPALEPSVDPGHQAFFSERMVLLPSHLQRCDPPVRPGGFPCPLGGALGAGSEVALHDPGARDESCQPRELLVEVGIAFLP